MIKKTRARKPKVLEFKNNDSGQVVRFVNKMEDIEAVGIVFFSAIECVLSEFENKVQKLATEQGVKLDTKVFFSLQ